MHSNNHTNDGKYLKIETWGGIVLFIAAAAGFILNNSSLELFYDTFTNFQISCNFMGFYYSRSFTYWVNNGLVSLFFLLVGLEIKELLSAKNLNDRSQITMPLAGAIFGVIVPAIIYAAFNFSQTANMRGWAIPTAMDTAFILAILALLGRSISRSLRLFVMTLSIIDDVLAVLVIAFFYAEDLSNIAIVASTTIFGLLILLNQLNIRNGFAYLCLGFALWMTVLGSGVHASIAGVLIALTIPIDNQHPSKCPFKKS